jgi:hypothetical protein
MSRTIENIYVLLNNPFKLLGCISSFYRNYENHQSNDILLAYLVFPLILYEPSKDKIKNIKVTSSLHTFMRNKYLIAGLHDRIEEFQTLTNKCLHLSFNLNILNLNDNLSITSNSIIDSREEMVDEILLRCSSNLTKLFKQLDIVTIYRLLGIKGLRNYEM